MELSTKELKTIRTALLLTIARDEGRVPAKPGQSRELWNEWMGELHGAERRVCNELENRKQEPDKNEIKGVS